VPPLRAVLFDFNGVIIDDEQLHFRAFATVLDELGLSLTERAYFGDYLALDDKGLFVAVLAEQRGEAPRADETARLVQRKAEAYLRLLEGRIRLFPGVVELVRDLAPVLALAINSGALRPEIDIVLAWAELTDCFAAIVSAEEVQACKPDPEGYLLALERLRRARPDLADLAAEHCLVIEDAPSGIRAARSAGMRCLAVANSRAPQDLAEADWVRPTLQGLDRAALEELFAG
jgi:beta-phosphoglucomutase